MGSVEGGGFSMKRAEYYSRFLVKQIKLMYCAIRSSIVVWYDNDKRHTVAITPTWL